MPEIGFSSGWDTFEAYSALHLVTVAACAMVVALIAIAGRAVRNSAMDKPVRLALASLALATWAAYTIWWNRNGIDVQAGLPLQVCDVGGVIAPLALLTGRRWLRATLYFWTFALTIQAYIQPVVSVGPASAAFWWFWITHTIIVMCAVYDIAARGFRPAVADLRVAALVTLAYGAAVMPVNVMFGANYGYIGNPAATVKHPAILDALGPWPLRVVFIAALALLAFWIAMLPWSMGRLWRAVAVAHPSRDASEIGAAADFAGMEGSGFRP